MRGFYGMATTGRRSVASARDSRDSCSPCFEGLSPCRRVCSSPPSPCPTRRAPTMRLRGPGRRAHDRRLRIRLAADGTPLPDLQLRLGQQPPGVHRQVRQPLDQPHQRRQRLLRQQQRRRHAGRHQRHPGRHHRQRTGMDADRLGLGASRLRPLVRWHAAITSRTAASAWPTSTATWNGSAAVMATPGARRCRSAFRASSATVPDGELPELLAGRHQRTGA